jgi:HTH-type transcriptional regulator / antitoxin HigA
MPATYQELLVEAVPEVIETREQYHAVYERFGRLFDRGRAGRSPEEEKLFRLLALLIQDYDRRHALPPDNSTPAERLAYLLEASQKTPADLISVFGQKSHVSEALKGKRSISADQARKLGSMFHLNPGYFL